MINFPIDRSSFPADHPFAAILFVTIIIVPIIIISYHHYSFKHIFQYNQPFFPRAERDRIKTTPSGPLYGGRYWGKKYVRRKTLLLTRLELRYVE